MKNTNEGSKGQRKAGGELLEKSYNFSLRQKRKKVKHNTIVLSQYLTMKPSFGSKNVKKLDLYFAYFSTVKQKNARN